MKRSGAVLSSTALAGALFCGCDSLPRGATLQSHQLYGVWTVFFWAGIGVAAVVYALIAWCIIRYRARGGAALPRQFRRNNVLEIVYTVIPLLMVGGLFAVTYPAERHTENMLPSEYLTVDVTGYRWSWRFIYPKSGRTIIGTTEAPPQLVLPVGETARLNVTSADVDHSFWVPAFLFKRDAIPGLVNHFDWTPEKVGVFRGECGEFCGLDHALMTFSVKVVPVAQFDRWIANANVPPLGAEPR